MKALDSWVGLLSTLGLVVLLALLARAEEGRLHHGHRVWQARTIETGAGLFEEHCARCHGRNARGALGPPLDGTSGLYGGHLGPGVAWRLEELGWDPELAYEYIVQAAAGGRIISTRPDRYPGNRPAVAGPTTTPRGRAGAPRPPLAMPPWDQAFGGPLRANQIDAIARYLLGFEDGLRLNGSASPTASGPGDAQSDSSDVAASEALATRP